jgi:PadR family transcriptional regulator PadR
MVMTMQGTARRSKKASRGVEHRDLYAGLIRLHVLHHACKEPVYGLAMIEELRRHGYELSAGTLYPMLHGLEQKGLLRSMKYRIGGTERRVYRATKAGHSALSAAKAKVQELFGELFEDGGES